MDKDDNTPGRKVMVFIDIMLGFSPPIIMIILVFLLLFGKYWAAFGMFVFLVFLYIRGKLVAQAESRKREQGTSGFTPPTSIPRKSGVDSKHTLVTTSKPVVLKPISPIKSEGVSLGGKEYVTGAITGTRTPTKKNSSSGRPQVSEQLAVSHSDAFQPRNRQFTIIELRQGTQEWLEWRHNGIGASDASTIMGESRFNSTAGLLKEKRGPARDSFQNEAMAVGKRLEPEARKCYVAKTGKNVIPACVQSIRYPWLRASLDGLDTTKHGVVEIKCGASVYRKVSQFRSVPDYYYGQVQHILAVTGFDSLDFWCYWPDHPELLIPVKRDDAYIERLLRLELEFWKHVKGSA